ncbi:DNA polymerase ligase N-terminal domain-containing protein [Thioalkalivibrio sp.]|uniref:DNA polymerase ligase N-terminal domain-containing protein n=1 Tax=Thioalkalivibrio sp. TaxID=2093813 RepID=UPI0012D6627A|nr:DNA polymerase ligase N-terminal domain-containing protein [Thioalkalivibrio sp.]TVP83126.1 MAG: DNA ligase [Thioalkalivibrio sp.]
MSLNKYRDKRDFRRTAEPRGQKPDADSGTKPIFVIQEHDASSHHFDLRLEIDGVLKSWSVPKGPSTDPAEKRMAIPTEDHPLDYADFEGRIPGGQYGAGTILLWDRGTWTNITEKDGETRPAKEALEQGHLLAWLDGEKIRGGYALHRTGGSDGNWLLIKMDDDQADRRRNPVNTEPKSVESGRTIDEVAADES